MMHSIGISLSGRRRYDYIVDAIDLVSCKIDLVLTARRLGIPLVMALGTGNKLDPAQLRLADLSETYGCPLARVMRKELRPGESPAKLWSSVPRRLPWPLSLRPRRRDGAVFRPATPGSPPRPACFWAAP